MNTDRLRIKADEGMSACARHCDRSCNGIHTLAASQGTGKTGETDGKGGKSGTGEIGGKSEKSKMGEKGRLTRLMPGGYPREWVRRREPQLYDLPSDFCREKGRLQGLCSWRGRREPQQIEERL
ncbi:hypothetical protein [Syntrophorhabdus aromaticivorans]|uniref:hypothetical protein n=1 Tax=Syntrophorhabdus aromaticivorans TaxID=328301 RepID=UPI00048AA668|nr:hypothetical protein [Syntrophorhabdus aromaticivorans]